MRPGSDALMNVLIALLVVIAWEAAKWAERWDRDEDCNDH